MRKTEKPIEDSQDGRDEAFLVQHSRPPRSSATVTLDQVREELVKRLELARAGSKAVDPTARAFASGHAAGLEDAIKLLDQVPTGGGLSAAQGGCPGQRRVSQSRSTGHRENVKRCRYTSCKTIVSSQLLTVVKRKGDIGYVVLQRSTAKK